MSVTDVVLRFSQEGSQGIGSVAQSVLNLLDKNIANTQDLVAGLIISIKGLGKELDNLDKPHQLSIDGGKLTELTTQIVSLGKSMGNMQAMGKVPLATPAAQVTGAANRLHVTSRVPALPIPDVSKFEQLKQLAGEVKKSIGGVHEMIAKPFKPKIGVDPADRNSISKLNEHLNELKAKRNLSVDTGTIKAANRDIANTERQIKKLQDMGRIGFLRKMVFGDDGLSGGSVGSFAGGSKGKHGLVGVMKNARKGLLSLPGKAAKGVLGLAKEGFGAAKKGGNAIQELYKKHNSAEGAEGLAKKADDNPASKVAALVQSVKDSIDKSKEKLFASLAPMANKLLDSLGPVVDKLLNAFKPLIDRLPGIVEALMPCFEGLMNTVVQLLPGLMSLGETIWALIQPIMKFVSSDAFGSLLKSVMDIANKIGQFLVPVLELLEPVFEVLAKIIGWVLDQIGKAFEFFTKMLNGIREWWHKHFGSDDKKEAPATAPIVSFSADFKNTKDKIKSKTVETAKKAVAAATSPEHKEKPKMKAAAKELGGNISGGGQKVININFKSFIDGGVRISAANIKDGLNTLEGDLKNMMYRILAGVPA